ncbi:MAG: DUF3047 domain-containing protein [Nitrospiraceae bacterium]|nr:DUF3047 domain-containing protein [Nitrospiraceae bacterium]
MRKGKHSCTIDHVKTTFQRRGLFISFIGTIIVSLCLHAVSLPAIAEDIPMLEVEEQPDQATPRGWELTTHDDTAELVTVHEEVGPALKLHADESSFSIQKEIDVNLRLTPWLVWQWKVTALPEQGDFTLTEQDDQAAQLILAFSKSFWEIRKSLSYIWGNTFPIGTINDTAAGALLPLLDMKAVVVRSGKNDMGTWISESRNVFEDYKQLYGKEPESVVGIRIQINSQHTKAYAESLWGRIAFTSNP